MKKLYLGLLSCGLLFSIYSCKKEDLSPYKGPQGEKGEVGKPGGDGDGYNLLIREFTMEASIWQNSSIGEYSIPELTQAYLDSGLIITYYKDDSTWAPLPFMPNSQIFMEAMYKPGEVKVIYVNPWRGFDLDFKLVAAIGFPGDKKALARYAEQLLTRPKITIQINK